MKRNSSLGVLRFVSAFAGLLVLPGLVLAQSSLTLLSSTSPASASPGGVNVTLTVAGFPSSTSIAASQITVTLAPAAGASGPTVTTAATELDLVYSSQSLITFRVPSSLTFSQPVAYGVTVSGPGLSSGNSAALTVNPPAAISSVSPSYAVQGTSVGVAITGSFSDFTSGSTTASFGSASGVTVTGLTINSPTSATAQVTVGASAPLCSSNVVLQTGVENATLAGGFTVAGPPSISGVSPGSGAQGSTLTFVVSGVNTHFTNASSVVFAGAGITANSVSASSATSLSVNVSVVLNAPLGAQSFTVSSGTESVSGSFTVTPPVPVITMVSPAMGAQGTSETVTITGLYTHFASGSVVSFGNSGVTAGTATVAGATSLTVPVTVAAGTTLGATSVTVTSGAEVATGLNAFTVVPLTAPVTGIVTASDGVTPVAGALVRLYQGNPLVQTAAQVTTNSAGSYTFSDVTGAFMVIALNAAKTQVGIQAGAVTWLATLMANVSLGGTGAVTVDVFDSSGNAVANANVTLTLTSFAVPADLASTLTASATANASGVATFSAFFAGSLFVSAGDPVTNHGGTTTGSVAAGGSVTIPLYFNINEVTSNIFSVLNGVVPGTIPATDQNETPFYIFSVLNGVVPGTTFSTGRNETPFYLFSVLNGSVPGSTFPTGTNETPFWILSVLNGTIPGSTLSTGMNEADFPLFSVGNELNANASPSKVSSLAVSSSNGSAAANRTHVVLPGDRVTAGQTIHIAASLDTPSVTTTVEFFINGVSFGSYAAPYTFDLTVPYTAPSLNVKALSSAGASDEAAIAVVSESTRGLRGRLVSEDGAPSHDTKVSLEYSGLRAELFHFNTPLTAMPDLTGQTPVATRTISGLDLRNPNAVFGKDPLATGLSPDYAIRFRSSLDIAEEGDYTFWLRGQDGAVLKIGGAEVADGGKVHLKTGAVPVEAVVFVGAGAMQLQLMWQPAGQVMQPVAEGLLWVRDSGVSAVTDLGGQFEFAAVLGSLGLVRVVADGVVGEAVSSSVGDVGVLRKISK